MFLDKSATNWAMRRVQNMSRSIQMAKKKTAEQMKAKKGWLRPVNGLIAAALVIGISLSVYVLSLARVVPRLIWAPDITIEPGGQVVMAAATVFGGTIALITFLWNSDQKQRHHEGQLDHERSLSEIQRMETEFALLAQDFASGTALARINAAIGMGDMAMRLDPRHADEDGKPVIDRDFDYKREWPDKWRSRKTERNYPFFMRVANRLAAALYMWNEVETRSQALRVLGEMAEWAKDEGTDEPLMQGLANAIAEANRTAKILVLESAGICLVAGIDRALLPESLGLEGSIVNDTFSRFENFRVAMAAFLDSVMVDADKLPGARAFLSNRPQVPEEELHHKLLADLHLAGKGMWATRDALVITLQYRSKPPDAPDVPRPELPQNQFSPKELETWEAEWEVFHLQNDSCLERCNLDLSGTVMYSAILRRVHFEGSDCNLAYFQGALCLDAHFCGVNCTGTHFEGVMGFGTHFEGGDFMNASFNSAVLTGAHFDESFCFNTNFRHANCQKSDFNGAICYGSIFDKTKLFNAEMGQTYGKPTQFEKREWENADFNEYLVDDEAGVWRKTTTTDTALRAFLEAEFEAQQAKLNPVGQAEKQAPEPPDDKGNPVTKE